MNLKKFLLVIQMTSLILAISPTLAANYYVSTTGSDTNPGSSTKPWRNPQRCVSPTPLVAGDTCIVRSGVYTKSMGPVVYVRPTAPAGTSTKPITIKSEVQYGATIEIPSNPEGSNYGFYINRPYYKIEGFDIRGKSTRVPNAYNHHGITAPGAVGLIVRKNKIHNIGRTVCSNLLTAESGITTIADNTIIEDNLFYTIGSLRNGENGCVTSRVKNLDHGLYISNFKNVTIRRNVFYDVNRGYAIHVYKSAGSSVNGLYIYNNVFADRSPNAVPKSQLLFAFNLSNVFVKNNIFTGSVKGYGIDFYKAGTVSNFVISNNMADKNTTAWINPSGKPASGITISSSNLLNYNPLFVNSSSRNYRLQSTSPAIDKGALVGLSYLGKAPDIGAYEAR